MTSLFRWRRPALVLAALGLASAVAGAAAPPGSAQAPRRTPGEVRYTDFVSADENGRDPAGMSVDLAPVDVESLEVDELITGIKTARVDGFAAAAEVTAARRRLTELAAESERLRDRRTQLTATRHQKQERLRSVERALVDLAVTSYVQGGTSLLFITPLDTEPYNAAEQQRQIVHEVSTNQIASRERLEREIRELTDALDAVATRLGEIRSESRAQVGRLTDATRRADAARVRITELSDQVPLARATADVAGADFTIVVLDAYYAAEVTLALEQPDCGIEWETLAAVGRIESRHGAYGGGRIDVSGQASRRILGIALDGENETRVIGDSDGGGQDGDPTYDRAIGPMQFIPETWNRFGRDGNGDGANDPHNLYDATLTAAVYLCRQGPGLGVGERLDGALRTYNDSAAYVRRVLELRRDYQALELPPPSEPGQDGQS